eukprot:1189914-Prorocentrum_minimum.AAC.4
MGEGVASADSNKWAVQQSGEGFRPTSAAAKPRSHGVGIRESLENSVENFNNKNGISNSSNNKALVSTLLCELHGKGAVRSSDVIGVAKICMYVYSPLIQPLVNT